MQKLLFPLAFIGATSLVACSFSLNAGSKKDPANQPNASATPPPQNTGATPPPAVTPDPNKPVRRLGKRPLGQPSGPSPTPTSSNTTPPPTPPAPSGAPVITGATIFGTATVEPSGYKGNIYLIPAGATKLPDLKSMTPNGYLFSKDLNVQAQPFTTGFPGVDATRKENFAIRYEAPLLVSAEADYDFRVVADDGAVLSIDNTPIVDNDGASATVKTKSGPVHLVAGTHLITVDYLQTGGNVALQLFCTKANDTEKICPTSL